MALIHQADLRPSKLELLAGWLPGQPWCPTGAGPLSAVGAYRFDDPAGEVGVETHLVRAGDGPVLQVPLTYRGAPLPGAEAWLVGTMEHSVLGRRWVYDACADPVYVTALAAILLGEGTQAEEVVQTEEGLVPRRPSVAVHGPGGRPDQPPVVAATVQDCASTTDGPESVIAVGGWQLALRRVLEPGLGAAEGPVLTGSWAGQDAPVLLAAARPA